MKVFVTTTRTCTGEQLIRVVARHLIARYRSADPHFSLVLTLVSVSREAKDTTKGDSVVKATIARISPRFRWA
jgi:hypothetical protein